MHACNTTLSTAKHSIINHFPDSPNEWNREAIARAHILGCLACDICSPALSELFTQLAHREVSYDLLYNE